MRKLLLLGALFLALFPSALFADQLSDEIEYLTTHLQKSDCTFVRNGANHDTSEALEHINKKYAYFKKKIKTTEDFIKYSATKSTISGNHYSIISGETTYDSQKYLLSILKKYRESRKGK